LASDATEKSESFDDVGETVGCIDDDTDARVVMVLVAAESVIAPQGGLVSSAFSRHRCGTAGSEAARSGTRVLEEKTHWP
jgi:hypothetical protein